MVKKMVEYYTFYGELLEVHYNNGGKNSFWAEITQQTAHHFFESLSPEEDSGKWMETVYHWLEERLVEHFKLNGCKITYNQWSPTFSLLAIASDSDSYQNGFTRFVASDGECITTYNRR